MYLLINTAANHMIELMLFDGHQMSQMTYEGKNNELLHCIDTFLRQEEKQKEDISGIAVVVGEGSFSSTRVAVTVANAWSYAASIPVIAISLTDMDDLSHLAKKLQQQAPGVYVSATYSAEPDIGSPKNHKII